MKTIIEFVKWIGVALIALIGTWAIATTSVAQTTAESESQIQEQTSLSSSEVDPNLKYVGDKIETALETLGRKLEQPAGHVYGVLVKQQTVKAWYNLIGIAGVFSIWLTIAGFFARAAALYTKDSYKYDDWFYGWCVTGIISTIALLLTFGLCISDVVSGFANPEYGALKDIFSVIS